MQKKGATCTVTGISIVITRSLFFCKETVFSEFLEVGIGGQRFTVCEPLISRIIRHIRMQSY